MVDFKRFLKLLLLEEQLCEINCMINELKKSNRKNENIRKNFCILNELKILKKQIIIHYKKHLQKYFQNNYSKLL